MGTDLRQGTLRCLRDPRRHCRRGGPGAAGAGSRRIARRRAVHDEGSPGLRPLPKEHQHHELRVRCRPGQGSFGEHQALGGGHAAGPEFHVSCRRSFHNAYGPCRFADRSGGPTAACRGGQAVGGKGFAVDARRCGRRFACVLLHNGRREYVARAGSRRKISAGETKRRQCPHHYRPGQGVQGEDGRGRKRATPSHRP